MSTSFPNGFLWGAATAGFQVEGNNINADWWDWETAPGAPVRESSGDAADHYHRYREDVEALAALGMNAFRFSVEWPRIEPRSGEFSVAELDHYRRVVATCREHGVEPVLTLNHMTLPRWASELGGWADGSVAMAFLRYAEEVLDAFGRDLTYVSTINEPELAARLSYSLGMHPPGHVDDDEGRAAAITNQMRAHRGVVDLVHDRYPWIKVGVSLACQEYTVEDGAQETANEFREVWEQGVFDLLGDIDWLGLQVYTRFHFGRPDASAGPAKPDEGYVARGVMPPVRAGARTTSVGYEFRPEAVGAVLREIAQRVPVPLMITENGVATDDDAERVEYLHGAVRAMESAITDGVPVIGYLHWSWLDNFEWAMGYQPRFGLVSMNRTTFERTAKPSAALLGRMATANAVI